MLFLDEAEKIANFKPFRLSMPFYADAAGYTRNNRPCKTTLNGKLLTFEMRDFRFLSHMCTYSDLDESRQIASMPNGNQKSPSAIPNTDKSYENKVFGPNQGLPATN